MNPLGVQLEQAQILSQNANVVKAPGQEDAVVTAPAVKDLYRVREIQPFGLELGLFNAGELAHPLVQPPIIAGLHIELQLVGDGLVLQHPHGADLDDFSMNRNRELLLR